MAINPNDNNVFRYTHFRPATMTDKLKEKIKHEVIIREKGNGAGRPKPTQTPSERDNLIKALKNLESLDLSKDVEVDIYKSQLTLTPHAKGKLTSHTLATLAAYGLDVSMSHLELVNTLTGVLANQEKAPPVFTPAPTAGSPQGYIQDVGTAKLLVVKQQIKRYEAGEIAHIENVLAGETKTRIHSKLIRSEEFFSTVTDTTTETETELETTERFELNKETSKTFQKDTELGLELTLSGKYGPTVSFDSNFSAGQTTSTSTADSQATNFAKNTVERSKERIVDRVRVAQKKTLIREIKEQNEHMLKNTDSDHKFAIYQYVDKIYESMVFDYGIRQMFDFMVPEPSSFLWYLRGKTAYETDIPAPVALSDMQINEPRDITKYNYLRLGALYGVNDLPPPPDIFVTRRLRLTHGTGATSDSGVHKTGVNGELDIPEGYQPNLVELEVLASSDETLAFSVNIGGNIRHYKKSDFEETDVSGGHKKYHLKFNKFMSLGHTPTLDSEQKLYFDIYGYESANYTFHFDVKFYALYNAAATEYVLVTRWKQAVYAKLASAYETALAQYEQEKSIQQAEAEADQGNNVDFGNPPPVNKRLIHNELKKHCITIIRNEHPGTLVTHHTGEPPAFNIADARRDGETIRFLETAFEWSEMQYVFYPYFWARPNFDQAQSSSLNGWRDKFMEHNNDYTMEEFLKAGYARVVVPVREGFEKAVSYFIENGGEVYFGLGEPDINDPLYVSITDEIKARTDAGKGEIPIGDPWETRLPTAAIIVRNLDKLPKWVKVADEDWKWEPDP